MKPTIQKETVIHFHYRGDTAGTKRPTSRKLIQYVVKFPPEYDRTDKYFDRKSEAKAWLEAYLSESSQ